MVFLVLRVVVLELQNLKAEEYCLRGLIKILLVSKLCTFKIIPPVFQEKKVKISEKAFKGLFSTKKIYTLPYYRLITRPFQTSSCNITITQKLQMKKQKF